MRPTLDPRGVIKCNTQNRLGPIGRFVRRTTLRENKRGPLIFRPRPANGTGKFWDTEDIETGFRTLSGRFLGSCKAETQPPLKRAFCGLAESQAQLLENSFHHPDDVLR
jgi:hypothetical protein